MSIVRLIAILSVASLAFGQRNEFAIASGLSEPKLPVVDYDACPGKGDPIPNVKLVSADRIYASPDKTKLIGIVSAGEEVTVLAGANVISQPDKARIKYVSHDEAGEVARKRKRDY